MAVIAGQLTSTGVKDVNRVIGGEMRFAGLLRALIAERRLSGKAVARKVPCDPAYISRLVNGKQHPSRQIAERLDDLLDAGGRLVACAPSPPACVPGPAARQMDHRRRVIQALDVLGNDHVAGVAEGLTELVDYYSHAICWLPPASVYDELLAVRSHAGTVLDGAGFAPRRADLVLAAGWLSALLAIAACDMGEHGAARVWCSDAERRSQDVRHPELAGWAILTRAMIAFYQGQPRQSGTLAADGRKAAPLGTVIHAKLAAQEMRAAAMLGDTDRMANARCYAAKAISMLPPDGKMTGAFSIASGEDPPYTATSLLFVGRFREAVDATNRVINATYLPESRRRGENPSGYARSLLILGLAHAGAGHLDEAVAAGQTALAGDRPAWPTMVLAGKLDQVLARDFTDTGQAMAYHARYLATVSAQAGHHRQLPGPSGEHS